MAIVQVQIPEEVLISLKESQDSMSQQIQILAAVKLFELGKLFLRTGCSTGWNVTGRVLNNLRTLSGFTVCSLCGRP